MGEANNKACFCTMKMIGYRLFGSEPIGKSFYQYASIFEIPKKCFIIISSACQGTVASIEIYQMLPFFDQNKHHP